MKITVNQTGLKVPARKEVVEPGLMIPRAVKHSRDKKTGGIFEVHTCLTEMAGNHKVEPP
jgi:hypothetical protein